MTLENTCLVFAEGWFERVSVFACRMDVCQTSSSPPHMPHALIQTRKGADWLNGRIQHEFGKQYVVTAYAEHSGQFSKNRSACAAGAAFALLSKIQCWLITTRTQVSGLHQFAEYFDFCARNGCHFVMEDDYIRFAAGELDLDGLYALECGKGFIASVESWNRRIPINTFPPFSRFHVKRASDVPTGDKYGGTDIVKTTVGLPADDNIFLDVLPFELRLVVLSWLDIASLVTLSTVSRSAWHDTEDWTLWKQFCRKNFRDKPIPRLARSTAIRTHLHLKKWMVCTHCTQTYRERNCRCHARIQQFKLCKSLEFERTVAIERVYHFYENCGSLLTEATFVFALEKHGGSLDALDAHIREKFTDATQKQTDIWPLARKRKRALYKTDTLCFMFRHATHFWYPDTEYVPVAKALATYYRASDADVIIAHTELNKAVNNFRKKYSHALSNLTIC
jgi:hypothetical protein